MTNTAQTPLGGDRLKKALVLLAEKVEQFPDKSRQQLLHEVELQFDLSPLECEFLNTNFTARKKEEG